MPYDFVDVRLRCTGSALLLRPHRSEVGSDVAAGPMADKAKLGGLEMAGSGNRVDGRGIRESFVSNQLIASILPSLGKRRNGEAMRPITSTIGIEDEFRMWTGV